MRDTTLHVALAVKPRALSLEPHEKTSCVRKCQIRVHKRSMPHDDRQHLSDLSRDRGCVDVKPRAVDRTSDPHKGVPEN